MILWAGFMWLRTASSGGFGEASSEHSNSIMGEEFLD
jgi:hypothetical protein